MAPPPVALTGLELIPGLQGSDNAGMPMLALGGLPRGNALQLRRPYVADLSAVTDADPGAGKLRWNNVSPASATVLYIDDVATDSTSLVATWASLTVGGYVYVQGAADTAHRANWQKWQVTSVTAATGYAKIGVSLQASAGAFTDGDTVELTIQQPTPSPGVDRNVVNTLSVASGSVTLDCSLGDYFKLAPTANVTGWTITNVPPACSLMIEFTQDTTARTVAWPASFKWAGGTAGAVSAASGAKDLLAMTTLDGGATWRATLAKAFA
ncbi:MAG: hypothetical protein ABS82_00960 [Rhodanobacter sp. SCN 67-45]|nr:MAG: hypothetical protein ABS82_00960 [Rhodanobacter sp. SCN 67-45]